jgi:integrase
MTKKIRINNATAHTVALPPGKASQRLGAGTNLHLLLKRASNGETLRYWIVRYTLAGKTREIGLGPISLMTLAEAKDQAIDAVKAKRSGVDPLAQKRAQQVAVKAEKAEVPFADALAKFIEEHGDWKNEVHREQWTRSLELHAPAIMAMPVNDIEHEHVFAALKPIWKTKRETASRVRGRIEAVIDYAEAEEWRTPGRINPAQWKGRLAVRLSGKGEGKAKRRKVRHHAARAWSSVPGFMADLAKVEGIAARCLAFTILTAARTGESLGATWSEIDMAAKVWRIPEERMKMDRPHEVPLSDQALAVLEVVRPLRRADDLVFPSPLTTADDSNVGWPLSNMAMLQCAKRIDRAITVHGFRSAFRDWAGDSAVPRELAEMALAHAIGSEVEAAYARSALLERRRPVMQAWADHCTSGDNVTDLDTEREKRAA